MIPMRTAMAVCLLVTLVLSTGAEQRPVLPKPTFENTFCLFPINESWHIRKPEDRNRLRKTVREMRRLMGPRRLYAGIGVAVISEGAEHEAYALARELGIGLILQGGNIEHHSHAWGFDKLLEDPQRGDRRFAQWFQDGSYVVPGKEGDFSFGVRACSSRYAEPVYELRKRSDTARAARVARAIELFPDAVLGCSGPIECEMHHAKDLWGDYSPFTLAEFRDWLTHRGIYASDARRAGLGYPGGDNFADDPGPDRANGDHPSFNEAFGTEFTTWQLRYWDPEQFPEPVDLDATGLPGPGQKGHIPGGFDAPRVQPGAAETQQSRREGNDRFWDAWASVDDAAPGFRSRLLNFWVRDHTRWLAEAGVPRDRIFSHQIPGESYGSGRLSAGASGVWTADTPGGSIGITTYFGAASDVDVFRKIVKRNENWGIFEYHPHPINSMAASVQECLHSLYTCIRFRAHILTPISWGNEGKDFLVKTGPFAQAMKQVLQELPDQPYYNRAYVDYAAPAVQGVKAHAEGDLIHVSWSRRIWPDRPFVWADWHDFDYFEVRDASGKVVARTRKGAARVPGPASGLQVVAVKSSVPPGLPPLSNVAGHRGFVAWDDCYDFYCDRYQVSWFSSSEVDEPLQVATTDRTRFDAPAMAGSKSLWCTVAAMDSAGRPGPASAKVRVRLPRAGREVVRLANLTARIDNSPNTCWQDVSVGGTKQVGIYQHPPLNGGWATMAYQLELPSVSEGRRIVFAAEQGLTDGADDSDGVQFQVLADGRVMHEAFIKPTGRWHGVEVDLTALAGLKITLELRTGMGGNSTYDWAVWGTPQVLVVGAKQLPSVAGVVAFGKDVRGQVALQWQQRASDGAVWGEMPGFQGFRVYRGAARTFPVGPGSRIGQTPSPQFVDRQFDGTQTFYVVTAVFADGAESPPSEAIQYAP